MLREPWSACASQTWLGEGTLWHRSQLPGDGFKQKIRVWCENVFGAEMIISPVHGLRGNLQMQRVTAVSRCCLSTGPRWREFPPLSFESEPFLGLGCQLCQALIRMTGQQGHHLEYKYFHVYIAQETVSLLDILAELCCYPSIKPTN